MGLHIGSIAPDFSAESSEGTIKFHDYLGNELGGPLLAPQGLHARCAPRELGYAAKRKADFDRRNVKVIALCSGPTRQPSKRRNWISDIEETQSTTDELPDHRRR